MPIYLPILSIHLSTYLSTYIYLSTHPFTYLPTRLLINLPIPLLSYLPIQRQTEDGNSPLHDESGSSPRLPKPKQPATGGLALGLLEFLLALACDNASAKGPDVCPCLTPLRP